MEVDGPIVGVSARGLTSGEAAERLARDGPNDIVPVHRGQRLKRLLGPFADPMVALLLVAAPTYLLIGETTDALVALVALGPIAAVGWLLESRAERTLDQLRRLAARTAAVVRDGVDQTVPASSLVVGDLVRVLEGDVVPADAAVTELTQLLVDESSLTGESLPASKQVEAVGDEAMIWAGTTVLSGRALARVTGTGRATRYGQIGALVAAGRSPLTPLQRGLVRLVRGLTVVAGVFCIAVVAATLLHGDGWGDAVIAGVSLAIAAIPEEFSMIYTLYLALGAWRLAQDRALVRRLPSVETLGSTTVICTDKTGTLTHGRLAVAGLWTTDGAGSDGGSPSQAEVDLIEAAVLACEPDPYDPLDVAIVDHARCHDVDVARLHGGGLARDWPFDPTDKYLTHVWRSGEDDTMWVAAKGAIEGILARSHADGAQRAAAAQANTAFSESGMRVVAVAAGRANVTATSRSDDEAHLRLLGLVAFSDPLRDGVAEALGECGAAGIRVVMITGDHPATAHAVAEGLGLPHEASGIDVIATGDDLDAADDERLDELVATTNVFARTRPEQKHRLVRALRHQGEVVAMTGDGINDAPALREADIGVAMGQRGTDVAREAAALILLDDNFATIVTAVRDGRRIFDNLTRAFAYLIAFHPPLLLGALVVPLLGEPLLLLPVHLVALELLLHPVVSLVFQADPPDPDTMRRPPRPVGDALRLRALARPYAVGTVLALVLLAVYLVALDVLPEDQARALAFASLLASQPVLLLSMRSADRPMWASQRPWTRTLTVVVAVIAVTTVAVVYVPALAALLHLEPFPAVWWTLAVAVAASTTWSEPFKRRAPGGSPSDPLGPPHRSGGDHLSKASRSHLEGTALSVAPPPSHSAGQAPLLGAGPSACAASEQPDRQMRAAFRSAHGRLSGHGVHVDPVDHHVQERLGELDVPRREQRQGRQLRRRPPDLGDEDV
ncbi:MAG TPA: cation-transporting P-type ATPase [Acidimicrobiales bacterium]|nr:cation-transporting P-type ATPase [Acidimicrobiales bacterium]